MRTQTRSSPQHPRPHHDVNSCSGLRMVKRARIGPLRPPLPLARCGRRGAKNFSPQSGKADKYCVPQKSPCLWHNLTRKVSPRAIVTPGRAALSGLDSAARSQYVHVRDEVTQSGLQRSSARLAGGHSLLPLAAPPSTGVLSSPRPGALHSQRIFAA
jgi:hypothetical protein